MNNGDDYSLNNANNYTRDSGPISGDNPFPHKRKEGHGDDTSPHEGCHDSFLPTTPDANVTSTHSCDQVPDGFSPFKTTPNLQFLLLALPLCRSAIKRDILGALVV